MRLHLVNNKLCLTISILPDIHGFPENSRSILYNFGLNFRHPGQNIDAASRADWDGGFRRGQNLRLKKDDADRASMSSSTSSAYLSAQEEMDGDESTN